jgi:(2Fe-2S) ferredoxin
MDTHPLPFKKILFVCTNCRESGKRVCCSERDSIELHANLKQWVKDNKLKRHIRVCKSGCMDRCEEGPNVLVMPDNVWISGLESESLELLKTKLLQEVGCEINYPT